ncbi:MAG: hypothetical protein JST79_06210 [Acidobacteria bacterium]|nr:hypothetical protein [Acidobacteriota bacterium]
MRIWGTILVALLISLPAGARELPLQELLAQAENAPLNKQPDLYRELAERQLKTAKAAYDAGRSDEGRTALQEVVAYARKAEDTAVRSGKKLKDTEIALRKMTDKLRDLKRSSNFDDHPPIQAATDELENLRTALLDRMFEKKKK